MIVVNLINKSHKSLRDKCCKTFKNNGLPDKATIDKSGLHALKNINDSLADNQQTEIHQNKYPNNIMEQDHRFIKKRTRPMLGFKNFQSANRTCTP